MSSSTMRIAVFGAGGLGGLFAFRLLAAGERVWLIARGAHLTALREHGLSFIDRDEKTVTLPAQATDRPVDIGIVDLVILATKTDAVPQSLEAVAPIVGPETRLLTVQNGLEAPLMAAEVYGRERVLASTVHGGGYTAGPGVVSLVGQPDIYDMALGELAGGHSERLREVTALLRRARIPAQAVEQIEVRLWGKFATMCAYSGMGALTRVTAGLWRRVPETRAMARSIVEEARAVAQAHGVALAEDFADRVLGELDKVPAEARFSMQRDVMQGKPSELHYLLGTLVRFAEKASVATPVAACAYHALLPQEMQARGET